MAMWEENLADTRPLSCLRAAQCALALQEKLNQYDAQGSTLSIKISLGYGKLVAFHVGGVRGKWEYFIGGPPLLQVTLAEHQVRHPGIKFEAAQTHHHFTLTLLKRPVNTQPYTSGEGGRRSSF